MPLPNSLPTPDDLFDAFTPPVSDQLVEALLTSCNNAVETHDESFGSNATTFGLNLYHFATHEISRRAVEGSGMHVLSRFPLFRARVGLRFELACYKVGDSGGDNIWTSFPNNHSGAASMVQSYLPGLEPNISSANKVVLAYMANPEDGLGAAYLCVATKEADNQIVEWGFAHELYSRTAMRDALAGPAMQHPEETIQEAEIARREPRNRNSDDAGE